MKRDEPKNPPVLTEFVRGKTSFLSRGYSEIKLTQNGSADFVRIPIRSVGVAELQAQLEQDTPSPPETRRAVSRNSREGRALGLREDALILSFDYTDRGYLKALAEHNERAMWALIFCGLDVKWLDEAGAEIDDLDLKKEALISAGITGHHLDQLIQDINNLSNKREVRADFLSGKISV